MKELLSYLKDLWLELYTTIKASLKLWVEALKLKLAIFLSDMKQRAYNKRYFVVLATVGIRKGKEVNRLRSINNREFEYFKRQKLLPKKMTYLELQQKAFYQTDLSRNNTQTREERAKALKRYLNYQRAVNAIKL